ncbi:MAG TPA: PilZ domain-containing protein [Thermodesulfobacteriota bacterium]|jgi:hypothetical protein|nr:PilZ domain-containing protein [Thermodesulfobacteriota bacterium]
MPLSHNINEKRKHPRVELDLPLEYRETDSPHAHGALVVNASESGFLVHSIKDMPVGTKLKVTVLFPKGFELANLEVITEIVWKDLHWGDHDGYQFGLKFLGILQEDHRKLKQLLNERDETF